MEWVYWVFMGVALAFAIGVGMLYGAVAQLKRLFGKINVTDLADTLDKLNEQGEKNRGPLAALSLDGMTLQQRIEWLELEVKGRNQRIAELEEERASLQAELQASRGND